MKVVFSVITWIVLFRDKLACFARKVVLDKGAKGTFRSVLDGDCPAFGVAGCMAAPAVGVRIVIDCFAAAAPALAAARVTEDWCPV